MPPKRVQVGSTSALVIWWSHGWVHHQGLYVRTWCRCSNKYV